MCEICGQNPCHPRCPNAPEPKEVHICSECLEGIYPGDRFYLVKSRGVSIGDAKAQTEYMLSELQKSYKSVWKVLQTATSVQEASDIFLVKFEAPTNTGSAVKKTRASYGEQYLKIYQNVDAMDTKPRTPELKVEMPPCSEEINYADGNIYVLFESASSKYFEGTDGKGKSICPIDRILTIDTNTIFP